MVNGFVLVTRPLFFCSNTWPTWESRTFNCSLSRLRSAVDTFTASGDRKRLHRFLLFSMNSLMALTIGILHGLPYFCCSQGVGGENSSFHHCLQLPSLTMSVQKSISALSPNSNRKPFPSTNAPSRTIRQSWKIHSVLTSFGAPSILDIATSQPQFHSSTVHLVRRLTMMRLLLITASLLSSKQWFTARI